MQQKNMRKRIWKNIEGFEGYEISNYGEVKSLPKKPKGRKVIIITKGYGQRGDYKRVWLSDSNSKKRMRYVHRLVAFYFIPNPLNLKEVNHKKGDKADNRAWMLEWQTPSGNQKHSYDCLNRKTSRKIDIKTINKIYKNNHLGYRRTSKKLNIPIHQVRYARNVGYKLKHESKNHQ